MATPTFTRFAGIRNTLPPERLHVMPTRQDQTTDLVEAVNVDLDNSGQVARRAGQTLVRAGAAHSLWAQGDMALFMTGSELRRLYPDYSSEVLASGLTPNTPACYVEVNGRIYWGNGLQSGVISGGANRSWGMDIPTAPGLSAVAGRLTPGQYQCVVTHVRNDSQESGAGLPSVIELTADGGIRVTWQAPSDAAIELVRVYLSSPDGTTLYLADECAVDDLYTEVSACAFALPLNTQWMDKPPAAQALAYANGRIYIAQGEYVFATTELGYEYVDLRDFLALDGTSIRLLVGVEGGLFAATANAAYFLRGRTFADMEMTIVSTQGGVRGTAILVDGAKATGNDALAGKRCAMFATGDGVFLGLPDGSVMNLTQERYRFDADPQGAAGFHENDKLNSYLLFLRQGG